MRLSRRTARIVVGVDMLFRQMAVMPEPADRQTRRSQRNAREQPHQCQRHPEDGDRKPSEQRNSGYDRQEWYRDADGVTGQGWQTVHLSNQSVCQVLPCAPGGSVASKMPRATARASTSAAIAPRRVTV